MTNSDDGKKNKGKKKRKNKSKKIDSSHEESFEHVREELRRWPYTQHQIHDTLDLSLIEGQAKQILFQALNTQSLTAFVGSGVSAAYGRMSWSEWQTAQLGTTKKLASTLTELISASLSRGLFVETKVSQEINNLEEKIKAKSIGQENKISQHEPSLYDLRAAKSWLKNRIQNIRYTQREINKLKFSFELCDNEIGNFPGGESLPIKFEIAQKLHDLCLANRTLYLEESLEKSSKSYEDTLFWGFRQDKSIGAPIEALRNITEKEILITDDSKNEDNTDESVSNAVKTYKEMELKFNSYLDIAQSFEGKMSFEVLAKALMVDECAHAQELLISGLECTLENGREGINTHDKVKELQSSLNIISTDNFKRNTDGIRQNSTRFEILQYFRISCFVNLLEHLKEPYKLDTYFDMGSRKDSIEKLLICLHDRLKHYQNKNKNSRIFVTPTSRFLIKYLLCLSKNPAEILEKLKCRESISSNDYPSRQSIIAKRFDPIEKIVRTLNIRRFLTTNYDFEIERFYQDLGFRRFERTVESIKYPSRSKSSHRINEHRVDSIGSTLVDSTLNPETAPDLITFSIGGDSSDAAVFHLHGRATEEDPLVITERNYMDLYLRNDLNRDMIDEGISMAFASSPILFLGLGMQESDVLRPLRQFISDNDRSRGYTAMVLIAANKSLPERAKFASTLYLRYGAHTIFFGGGEIEIKTSGGEKKKVAIDWLYRISRLIEGLNNITQEQIEIITRKLIEKNNKRKKTIDKALNDHITFKDIDIDASIVINPQSIFNDLKEKYVGKLNLDLVSTEQAETICALSILFGVERIDSHSNFSGNLKLESPIFTTIRPGQSDAERNARTQSNKIEVNGDAFLSFYLDILTHIFKQSLTTVEDDFPVHTYLRELSARQAALGGINSSILTATFSASLTAIEKEWRSWWSSWQQSPPHRKPLIESIPYEDKTHKVEDLILPRRFIRHRVLNTISNTSSLEVKTCPTITTEEQFNDIKTNVRAFDSFIEAIFNQSIKDKQKERNGRRSYTIAAKSGMGKGSFFSTITTQLGFSSYIQASNPNTSSQLNSVYMAGLFLNFNFSTEIASVYDMTLNVLRSLLNWMHAINWIFYEFINNEYGKTDISLSPFNKSIISMYNRSPCSDNKELFSESFIFEFKSHIKDLQFWETTLPTLIAHGPQSEFKEEDGFQNVDSLQNLIKKIKQLSEYSNDCLTSDFRDIGRSSQLRILLLRLSKASNKLTEICKFILDKKIRVKKALPVSPRLIICMNGCELLFSSDRVAKNLEIGDFISYMTGDEMADVPIDLLFIGSETKLGLPWFKHNKEYKSVNSTFSHRIMMRKNIDTRALHLVSLRVQLSGIECDESDDKAVSVNQSNYIYFSRILNPTRLLVDNFLPLAILLHLSDLTTQRDKPNLIDKLTSNFANSAHNKYCTKTRDSWTQPLLGDPYKTRFINKDSFESELIESVYSIFAESHVKDDVKGTGNNVDNKTKSTKPERTIDEKVSCFRNYINKRFGPEAQGKNHISLFRDFLADEYCYGQNNLHDEWRSIRHALSANRYCMTLLLAAAQEIALTNKCWETGATNASNFIRNTIDQVLMVSNSMRENTVLQAALDAYNQHHIIGNPARDIELQQHILRNLSVINSPTSANVVTALPVIREYLNSIGENPDIKMGRRRKVAFALMSLGERGLIFRLSAHANFVKLAEDRDKLEPGKKRRNYDPTEEHWPESKEYRFALHRSVQRYCISKLGNTKFEPVQINSFSPSLYAAMPSDVPRLKHESYRFLRALLVGLSQYPDIPHSNLEDPVWLYSTLNRATKVQSLRAAMSMIRSTLSIAVVSRFEEYKSIPGESQNRSRGYFETYKVRLRWIIRKAWELYEPDRKSSGEVNADSFINYKPDSEFKRINALYRDEIVWLYNEVGLTCLVQGNMVDAVSLIRKAIVFNADIEGPDGGRQHSILSLNLAIIQIERGRIDKAEARLSEIKLMEKNIKGRVYYLAIGYLGLIAHITGHKSQSKEFLEKAIQHFETRGEDRATAIFKSHLARLIAASHNKNAHNELNAAKEFAESGGHEDIRHRILISQVQISQFKEPKPHNRLERDHFILSEIEEYAKVMGIPSLLCDALHLRGKILLATGDLTSSGKLLVRAMAIAKRNELQLKLNSMLTTYSRVLLERGLDKAAKQLLIFSMETAKRSNYNIQIDRIQTIIQDAKI